MAYQHDMTIINRWHDSIAVMVKKKERGDMAYQHDMHSGTIINRSHGHVQLQWSPSRESRSEVVQSREKAYPKSVAKRNQGVQQCIGEMD